MGAVFGHDQGLWFGQVEHLPGNVVRGHRGAQRLAAPCAGLGEVIDRGIGRLAPAQGLARVPVLPARLLAGPLPQPRHRGIEAQAQEHGQRHEHG